MTTPPADHNDPWEDDPKMTRYEREKPPKGEEHLGPDYSRGSYFWLGWAIGLVTRELFEVARELLTKL